jgi:hypothetical protein
MIYCIEAEEGEGKGRGKMASIERSGAKLSWSELHAEQHPHGEEGMTAVYVFCNVFGSESTPYPVHAYCTSKRLISELCILKSMSSAWQPPRCTFLACMCLFEPCIMRLRIRPGELVP